MRGILADIEDAGGSRTHFNRVAAGGLAVWLQRHSLMSHVPARN